MSKLFEECPFIINYKHEIIIGIVKLGFLIISQLIPVFLKSI